MSKIEISAGTIIKIILFLLLIGVLYYIRDIVLVVLFSIVVASAIEPITSWFEKRHIPRTLSVLFLYFSAFLILGTLFYLIVPTFISEISNFASELPQYFENPKQWQTLFGLIPNFPESLSGILGDLFNNLQNKITTLASGFFQATADIFGGVMSLVLIIVLSFYLAVQKNGLENFIKIVTPSSYESYILDLWTRSRNKIGLWLQGQILLGVLVGVLVFLGLTILGVKHALVFALLAAVFELIPFFGPILASIPPIAIAFLQNPPLALAVVALFVIIQQFENHLIYPLVVGKIAGVPAILVILALLIGGKLAGFFGILLAVPMAAILMEFLNDVAKRKHLVAK